ncbi:Kelch domain-containing protein 10 [Thelohanellus kitauei]|uniref:Kelch domain-containing protein 10 n=1 Tax=Thelohanellus kitauei TaxID=669202 RepID=A0A0C2NIX3_THEKT|nr:Kelch domain-containing protein 10 [Thelohanellus kitauei]
MFQRGPVPRMRHGFLSVREYIVICGGSDKGKRKCYKDLWTYNTLSGVWMKYLLPTQIKNASAYPIICADQNLVYIFGAENIVEGYQEINSLFSFDVKHGKWERIYYHPRGHDNGIEIIMFSAIFHDNGFMYLMGNGWRNRRLDLIYKFCLETLTWSLVVQIGETPKFKCRFCGTVYKINATIRGRVVHVFDFTTNIWTKRSTSAYNEQYPPERVFEAYAFSSTCAYMSGGPNPDWSALLLDIWKIDFETLQWVKLDQSLQRGLWYHRMSVVQDSYLYHVGSYHEKSRYLNGIERLILRIPTLFRISFEAVCRSPNSRIYIASLPETLLMDLNFSN